MFIFVGHLRRQDYQSSDRVVWTIVLTTAPVIGILMYLMMSNEPLQRDIKSTDRAKDDAEAEKKLKAKLNSQA